MKKNLLFISIIFLGVSLIISSFIISKSLYGTANMNATATLNGSLTVSNTDYAYNDSDVLQAYDAGAMLGYDYDAFVQAIKDRKLEGIPYIDLGDHYIFSKKALEEWVYKNSTN